MNKVTVHKADPITGDMYVESATIVISEKLPETNGLREAEEMHKQDAALLFKAMKYSLPQGTRHEVAKLFIIDSANLYRGL